MKKSVAVLALSASTSSFAMMAPSREPIVEKTICLMTFEREDGSKSADVCDSSRNNVMSRLPILENGCAADQVAIVTRKVNGTFDVQVRMCLPPNVAQL